MCELDFKSKPERSITSWKCFLFGHDFKDMINDSGYGICGRCMMHQFYDNEPDIRSYPRMDDYPFYDPTKYWIHHNIAWPIRCKYQKVKDWLFAKKKCDICLVETMERNWRDEHCPKCGAHDPLPF